MSVKLFQITQVANALFGNDVGELGGIKQVSQKRVETRANRGIVSPTPIPLKNKKHLDPVYLKVNFENTKRFKKSKTLHI